MEVELSISESIVERGTSRVSWGVQQADGWVAASEWPDAVIVQVEPGPGTVWERLIRIEVKPGTRVRRREALPAPWQRRTAMQYLEREARGAPLQVRERFFQVTFRGGLDPT